MFRLLGEERKSLMGLSSVLVSLGSMTGGLLLITFKDRVRRTGRSPVVIFGLLVHLVRLAQLPGTLGLLGRQDGEPLLLRSLVLLDLVLHLVVKVSTIFCDNFHNIRKRHILAQQLLVLYELVHECIMGTGTEGGCVQTYIS